MKVVYTEEALRNLDEIRDYIRENYPAISEAFQLRLRFVVARIANGRRALKRLPVNPA
jgi:plasmid stabilization system protein ParE